MQQNTQRNNDGVSFASGISKSDVCVTDLTCLVDIIIPSKQEFESERENSLDRARHPKLSDDKTENNNRQKTALIPMSTGFRRLDGSPFRS